MPQLERPPTGNEFQPDVDDITAPIGLLNFAVFLHLLPGAGAGAEAVAPNTHAAPTPP
jgi:hypothetical protein